MDKEIPFIILVNYEARTERGQYYTVEHAQTGGSGTSFCLSLHGLSYAAHHNFTKIPIFAMSERPIMEIKLPELKDLVIALKDLVECHALGLQLGLPESKLALIDKHPVENHLRMMLSEWLQFDTEASWEKLTRALGKIGKNAIAANIRQEFVIVSGPPTQSLNLEQEAKRRMYPCITNHTRYTQTMNTNFQCSKLHHTAA